ncbi:MAG: GAF domain-containing protein [Nitrospirota bacterium]
MFRFRSITSKFIFISAILLSFLTAFVIASFIFTRHMEGEAKRINLAGKERMLTIDIARHLSAIADIPDPSEREGIVEHMRQEINMFEEVLYGLRDGNEKYGLKVIPRYNKDAIIHLNQIIETWEKDKKPNIHVILQKPDKVSAREYDLLIYSYVDNIDRLVESLEKYYEKEIDSFDTFRLYALGFFFLSAIFIIFYIRQSIVRPLHRLRDTTKEIEKGSFDVELDIKGRDEIGQLGGAYKRMAQSLQSLFNEKTEHIQELDALYKISETAIQTLSVEDTLDKVMDSILGLSQLRLEKKGAIFLCDEKTKTLKLSISRNFTEEHKNLCNVVPFGECLCGIVAETMEPLVVNDSIGDKRHTIMPSHSKEHGHIILPLIFGNKVIGVLCLYISTGVIISDRLLNLYKSIADITSISLKNSLSYQEISISEQSLQEHSEELLSLSEATSFITTLPISEDIYDSICSVAVWILRFKMTWIGLIEEGGRTRDEGRAIKPVAQSGFEDGYLSGIKITWDDSPTGMGPTGMAIKTHEPMVMNDIEHDPDYQPCPKDPVERDEAMKRGYRSSAAFPMISSEGRVTAVINFYSSEPHFFTEERIKLLTIFCKQASTVIELRRLIGNLEEEITRRIADIKLTNIELRKLMNAIEQSAESIIITDTAGIIEYINPAFTQISGFSKKEAIGRTPTILHSGMTPPGVFKDMWETILSGKVWKGTVINRKKNGEIYHEEMTVTPVLDEEGKIINFIAIKNNVTDRVRADAEIKRKNLELAEFGFKLHHLYEMSFVAKPNAHDFAKNILDDLAEMLDVDVASVGNISRNEWIGYAIADRKGLGFKEGMRFSLDEVYCGIISKTRKPLVITDASKSEEFKNHPDLAKYGMVSYCGVPVFVGNDFFGILCTFSKSPHNYTDYDLILHQLLSKRLEFEFVKERYEDELRVAMTQADAASRAKSDFLANMSHELRTPLNTIIGFSEMMVDGMAGTMTAQQKEYIADIYDSGKHLLSLIDDILDLSKIEAGKLTIEQSEFSLRDVINASLVMFREKALKHNIKTKAEIGKGAEYLIADERKIKQVIINLLSNGFKFTPDGGAVSVLTRKVLSAPSPIPSPHRGEEKNESPIPSPHRGVEKHESPIPSPHRGVEKNESPLSSPHRGEEEGEGGFFIEISVEDTGIGISPEDQMKLFQPFQQVETALSKKYPGTGLGLNLSKKIIELHGGKIWVESEVGKGSRFIFVIPMKTVV